MELFATLKRGKWQTPLFTVQAVLLMYLADNLQQRKTIFFSINPSEDKRIKGQQKKYDSYKGIFHYFKAQDFENVSINTKSIQTTHKLFLTAGALLKGNC